MKRYLIELLLAGALLAVCIASYVKGYRRGQEHPKVFWYISEQGEFACGWDEGNQCVAMWTRYADGTLVWTRLEDKKAAQRGGSKKGDWQ